MGELTTVTFASSMTIVFKMTSFPKWTKSKTRRRDVVSEMN